MEEMAFFCNYSALIGSKAGRVRTAVAPSEKSRLEHEQKLIKGHHNHHHRHGIKTCAGNLAGQCAIHQQNDFIDHDVLLANTYRK